MTRNTTLEVHLANAQSRKQIEIDFNNGRIRYNHRQEFFYQTFDFLVENQVSGDYLEFGCHKAMTFRMALKEAARRGLEDMSFHAFDSFEGLPELSGLDALQAHSSGWRRGALSTSEETFLDLVRQEGVYLDRISTVKGFYEHSLTDALRDELGSRLRIALAFIDCDLYESTASVLRFIEPMLQRGSVVYFDDYFQFRGDPNYGEQKAFGEFAERSRWKFNPHLQVSWFGKSFIVY